MSDAAFNLETKGLDKLLKAIGSKRQPVVRAGILGEKTQRKVTDKGSKKVPTNAEVGACHEFGTTKLPVRSFLRVPISTRLQKEMENSGAFDKSALRQVLRDGSVIPWLRKIAVLAEKIVLEAFDSGGFGEWKPSNMTYKKNHQTLIESQQLRNSITSEVKA